MTDRELLIWLHAELEERGVSPFLGYMHSLRHIIYSMSDSYRSPEIVSMNGLDDLQRKLEEKVRRDFRK